MKPIVAENQVKLGPARCAQLALTGMSYRMFRSLITIAILALAVAFLVHMLAYGLLSGATKLASYEELSDDREAGQAVTRLTNADSAKMVLLTMTQDREPRLLTEYRGWSGVDDAAFDAVLLTAADAARFAGYLEILPAANHAALVGDDTPLSLLSRLSDPGQLERFEQNVRGMRLAPPLGSWEDFRLLVTERWPRAVEVARTIRRGHGQAIKSVRTEFPGLSARKLFAASPEGLGQAMRDAGFEIQDQELAYIAEFVERTDDIETISAMLADEDVRQAFARRLRIDKNQIHSEVVFGYVDSGGRARWLAGVLSENNAPAHLDASRIAALGEHYRRQAKLEAAAGGEPPETSGFMGLPASTLYLIGLSFIVCMVGVANAMLMSVTERFTEIATMKCLGAMDRFVMMMFVFEAAIQGVIGGLAGLALGILLALLRGFVEFGSLLGSGASAAGQIVVAALLSLGVGVLLATIAAVGPSWVASRLAPMEAMRVD